MANQGAKGELEPGDNSWEHVENTERAVVLHGQNRQLSVAELAGQPQNTARISNEMRDALWNASLLQTFLRRTPPAYSRVYRDNEDKTDIPEAVDAQAQTAALCAADFAANLLTVTPSDEVRREQPQARTGSQGSAWSRLFTAGEHFFTAYQADPVMQQLLLESLLDGDNAKGLLATLLYGLATMPNDRREHNVGVSYDQKTDSSRAVVRVQPQAQQQTATTHTTPTPTAASARMGMLGHRTPTPREDQTCMERVHARVIGPVVDAIVKRLPTFQCG